MKGVSEIFNILMIGFRRILKKDRIYLKQNQYRKEEKNMKWSLTITASTKTAIAEDSIESDHIIKDELYNAYLKFCKFHHLPYESKENLALTKWKSLLDINPYWKVLC